MPNPMPNAADKAALKAIAATVIQTCPSLQDAARQVASDLLIKYQVHGLDPDQVYFHRFDASQSSSNAFTGWEHVHATPTSSMTLTQLVIHRFRVADQDNADLLDVYGGFYTAGPDARTFDERNEVRLHGNDVLKDFWSIDFSALYDAQLNAFWNTSGSDFRTLAKCNFLIKALQARDKRQLSGEDFQFVTQAAIGPLTWPVSLPMLQTSHPCPDSVRTLDIAGYAATNVLRFVAPQGRQILYLPGESDAFQVLESSTDLHFWILQRMNKPAARETFLAHFSLADRQQINANLGDLMNRLVATWGRYDHSLINQDNRTVSGDAFTWLSDSTRVAMFAEANLSLTSNGDLRKQLWIGYLSAGVKVFGPMAVVGWPIALPVIGASIASMGLNIDQAVNGKTAAERKAGILGAVLSGIDMLFNLLVLKGPGLLEEVGPQIDAAEATEMADLIESQPKNPQPVTPQSAPMPDSPAPQISHPTIPQSFRINRVLGEDTLINDPGKFRGIHRMASNPSSAIMLDDSAYYVRFEQNINGRGTWAIIDPTRPDAFSGSIPVRLNVDGVWEIAPGPGLRGGLDTPMIGGAGHASEPAVEQWAQTPGIHVPGLDDPAMRAWALGGPDLQGQYRRAWTLGSIDMHSVIRPETGVGSALMPAAEDAVVSLSEFDLAQEQARTVLISDANAWYELHPPVPRQPVTIRTSFETSSELFEAALARKPGLIIGEGRGSIGSKQLLIENMPNLARNGVKTLYLQELLANVNQLDLDEFARTAEMSEELRDYLTRIDFRAGNDPDGKFNLMALVKAANAQRIRVQAIDLSTTYNLNKDPLHPFPNQQMTRSFFAGEVIRFHQELNGPGKWIALVNQENMSTFRGYQGISEQTDALSVRIDDVIPGQAQAISSDPGLAVEYADYPDSPVEEIVGGLSDPDSIQNLLKGDWRVQVQTPWAYRTPQNLRALLPEPGMFTFQRYRSSLLVVYRNAERHMADSVIRMTPAGRLNLDTPLAPAPESLTVDTLDELKQALIEKGLKPMGWPPVSVSTLIEDAPRPVIPPSWQANELLDGMTPVSEPGKFNGIYLLDSNPSTAIMMDDTAYYVRYEADINGSGHWAVIDPEHPHGFTRSIPVRLNPEGEWEAMPRAGLSGGGKSSGLAGSSSRSTVTALPASQYDVPAPLKAHLEEGAAGLNDEALRDFYDSLNEFDAYRDFKVIRKRLYHDALDFFSTLRLPDRPPVPALAADATAEEIIEKILEHARGLVLGESHTAIGSKQWLIENMPLLASKQVKSLYMEHLLTDFHQAALDEFFRTGNMPQKLEAYLKALDVGNMTDPLERYTFLELVKEARKQGIHVQAIDCMASYRLNGMDLPLGNNTARQKMMNYFARLMIRADQSARGAHKWVALMGNSHSNTFDGVAGVSELEEAIGIRVEDVAEGTSRGIEVDPGRILPLGGTAHDRSALVRGDLRLQIETPWTAHTMTEFETLLPRYGMYSLKQQPNLTFIVHRSRTRELVRTVIDTDGKHFYIERPGWTSVSGKRYPSMKALLQALDDMGMQLGGWSKPL